MKRLAIITTHPIQYNAPLFRLLAERGKLAVKVFYTWGQAQDAVYDPGFGKARRWDIPLLEGYDSIFLPNTAKDPGSHHFGGIVNPTILTELKAFDPAAILVYGWSFRSHLQVLRYFKGKKKLLFRGDSTLLNEVPGFSWKKTVRRLGLRWVYHHIDVALYVGAQNKKYYLASGLKECQLLKAPHAVDNQRFAKDPMAYESEAQKKRAAWGIPAQDIVFLFAGKFQYVKNAALLVEAFKQLEAKNTWLVLVGNGPEEAELKKSASGQDRIIFADFQNQLDMPMVYRWGDLYVLPSKSETWGLAINEAFACGRPVVVSDRVGCAFDLVLPGRTGWLFPSGEVGVLKKCLEEAIALGKPGLRHLGAQAYELIQAWSFEAVAEAIEKAVADAD